MSYVIVAMDEKHGISRDGAIPWADTTWGREDLTYFKHMTTGHAVLMGWSTYVSIGRLLPDRLNIIVTDVHYEEAQSQVSGPGQGHVFRDMDEAVMFGRKWEVQTNKRCFIIGGEQVYTYYLNRYNPIQEFITIIPGDFNCDKFYPGQREVQASNAKPTYLTIEHHSVMEERKYLDLFQLVIGQGHSKQDRTGTGALSVFSPPELKFSLAEGTVPVLTTKTVALKTGVIPELLWFISGSTDTRKLEAQGCNIWKGNTSREFLDKRGLSYKEKDMGPGYGFQWRHSGAEYHGMEADYTGQGVDQLQTLIKLLKEEPDSRRMLMCSWVAPYLHQMALPPCHIMYQVYTHVGKNGKRYLSAKMYQRSCDSFLGVPFNIASYAILTHIIAEITGYVAHELTMSFGDYHIYNNHLEQINKQLERAPRSFPKIFFNNSLKNEDISNVTALDFSIVGYSPWGPISAPMAI